MKDLGELKFFLGIEFARSRSEIVMSQRKYAMELISEMGLAGAKPAGTPLETNLKLTSVEYDIIVGSPECEDTLFDDIGAYQRLVGMLLYLTMTRVDITFVVQVLSQFMHKLKQSHWEAALRVVKYVKTSPCLGILMPSKGLDKLEAYCDLD
ncbi:uncharacterized mitochondrial protein AtMg00810-like [Nicotiana tomentosiformis]|uniref:uncharacterized mitochondrial protein AtMg00810-like n=1 Tax=Nicotiana tomentosiformis TaxID=4098 RepID=UPI00388C7A7C